MPLGKVHKLAGASVFGGILLKIGILGGTGNMGAGLAVRWALRHDVLLGSRSLDKACEVARKQESIAKGYYQADMKGSITGDVNCNVAKESDIVVVALPPAGLIQTLTETASCFTTGQTVISTVVSMKKRKGLFSYVPLSTENLEKYGGKSAAEVIQAIVGVTPVVSAFQTVPAAYLSNVDSILNIDVLVASDYPDAIATASRLIGEIPNLRPLQVGALANSALIESLTPLLLNAAILNNLKEPSVRIVPWMPKCYDQIEPAPVGSEEIELKNLEARKPGSAYK